jgi:hypothetical protein
MQLILFYIINHIKYVSGTFHSNFIYLNTQITLIYI